MFKNRGDGNVVYKCTVRLLEDTDILECEFQPHHKGRYLLEHICDQLGLTEKDYFGLRYVDATRQRHWLDLAKSIIKQMKDVDPLLFSFRVKFYPAEPFRLQPVCRSALFLQLKRDLKHGRLYCSLAEAAAMGACVVQDELGDYDSTLHTGDYVAQLRLSLRQSEALEKRVAELYEAREPGGDRQAPRDEFLALAGKLDTYGVDPHPVKDHRGTQLYLGLNHTGISTFASGKRAQHFRWQEVHKINYEGKMFIAHLTYTDKKHTVGFKCPTGAACRHLWRCAIEQMLFFTLPTSSAASSSTISGGGFFSWGTRFRYSGATERELLQRLRQQQQQQQPGEGEGGTSPGRRKASSVPATPSSPQDGDMNEIRYSSLPRSALSAPLSQSLGETANSSGGPPYGPEGALPLLETVSEERRPPGLGEISDPYNDYYFRDSFDHSSSESQLTSIGASGNMQASDTLTARRIHGHVHTNTSNEAQAIVVLKHNNQNLSTSGHKNPERKFHLLRVFIPSFVFVVVILSVVAVLVFETDSETLVALRNFPEMVILRYQYYQPIKDFLYGWCFGSGSGGSGGKSGGSLSLYRKYEMQTRRSR